LYKKESTAPDRIAARFGLAYRWTSRKFYIDEVYLFITKNLLFNLIGRPAAWFDRNVVDGLMNAFAWVSLVFSEKIKHLQNGRLQTYSAFFLGGVLILAFVLLYKFL
jgi:NADH-quinone oxidoreductase subunit L